MWCGVNLINEEVMNINKDLDKWENRELGAEMEYAQVVSEKSTRDLDAALGLKMISLRLPEDMIQAYKWIAAHHGIGYQPLMRDILQRFVNEGLKEVIKEQEKRSSEANDRIDEVMRHNVA